MEKCNFEGKILNFLGGGGDFVFGKKMCQLPTIDITSCPSLTKELKLSVLTGDSIIAMHIFNYFDISMLLHLYIV